jgi:hypothetical protein
MGSSQKRKVEFQSILRATYFPYLLTARAGDTLFENYRNDSRLTRLIEEAVTVVTILSIQAPIAPLQQP